MSASFSIVTPSYNQGTYIRATIDSILSQEIPGLQYYVIDGGSTDETLDVLRSFDRRIRWISEPDKGTADAINKGFKLVGGDILAWLNSDDIYYEGALAAVQEFFEQNPEVDVVYGEADHIDENGTFIEKYPTEPWSWERFCDTCFISQPAAFFRRRVWEEFGGLDSRYPHCVDYELWIRWSKAGARFQHLPKMLAATRLHAEAKTVAKRLECHADINNILRDHLGKVPQRWISNYAYAAVDERGLARDQKLRFTGALIKECLIASARWNRSVEWKLTKTLIGLMSDAIRHEFRNKS
jgi:glycosyltransferase involved in cell wall biosynthesis